MQPKNEEKYVLYNQTWFIVLVHSAVLITIAAISADILFPDIPVLSSIRNFLERGAGAIGTAWFFIIAIGLSEKLQDRVDAKWKFYSIVLFFLFFMFMAVVLFAS